MHNYKQLAIWKDGISMAVEVYKLMETLPSEEKFGLISQIKRSSVSIPSNIAEGAGRGTNKDFCRFIDIAVGSSCELDTQLIIAKELTWLEPSIYEVYEDRIDHLQKRMFILKQKLLT